MLLKDVLIDEFIGLFVVEQNFIAVFLRFMQNEETFVEIV